MSDNVQNSEDVWRCERPYQRKIVNLPDVQLVGTQCFLSPHFSPSFALAVFRAAPQLTERLEEANSK